LTEETWIGVKCINKKRRRRRKRRTGLFLVLILIVSVLIGSFLLKQNEAPVASYEKDNYSSSIYQAVLKIDDLCVASDNISSDELGIKATYWNGEHPIIEYTIGAKGLVSSSRYYGIFYSFDDVPVAFQNANVSLIPISDEEWEWKDGGDNRGIVRKIESNWYYFEASF